MNISPEMRAWNMCLPEDLWIFDKLIVAKKAGHLCGPRGIPVPKPGEKIPNIKPQASKSSNVFLDGLVGVLTSVKNVQVNYTRNEGTVLPGFLPSLGFFGSSKPSLGFVFGIQDDVRFEAAKNGWLTTYPDFNQNYTQVLTETLEGTANIDLFPDFKIDLGASNFIEFSKTERFI
jgi:cell surface protein SprA